MKTEKFLTLSSWTEIIYSVVGFGLNIGKRSLHCWKRLPWINVDRKQLYAFISYGL